VGARHLLADKQTEGANARRDSHGNLPLIFGNNPDAMRLELIPLALDNRTAQLQKPPSAPQHIPTTLFENFLYALFSK